MKANKFVLSQAIACAALSLSCPSFAQAQGFPAPTPAVPPQIGVTSAPPVITYTAVPDPLPTASEEERLKAEIAVFDSQRAEAAQAVFRLGECYRQLKQFEEARIQYARILREFTDSPDLVRQSAQLLQALEPFSGGNPGMSGGASRPGAASSDSGVPVLGQLPILGQLFRKSAEKPGAMAAPGPVGGYAVPSPGLAPTTPPVPTPALPSPSFFDVQPPPPKPALEDQPVPGKGYSPAAPNPGAVPGVRRAF